LETQGDSVIKDQIVRKLLLKFEDWKYEDEVRILWDLDTEPGGMTFSDFGPQLKRAQLLTRLRCTVSKQAIDQAVGDYDRQVDVTKVALSTRHFCMVVDDKGFGC
jgi:hypothetical protein